MLDPTCSHLPGFAYADGECTACLPGRYQLAGLTTATVSLNGSITSAGPEPSPLCTKCQSGSAVLKAASFQCDACTIGHAVEEAGSAACFACSPGRYANSTGQSICEACDAGRFSNGTACILCGYELSVLRLMLHPHEYFEQSMTSYACIYILCHSSHVRLHACHIH